MPPDRIGGALERLLDTWRSNIPARIGRNTPPTHVLEDIFGRTRPPGSSWQTESGAAMRVRPRTMEPGMAEDLSTVLERTVRDAAAKAAAEFGMSRRELLKNPQVSQTAAKLATMVTNEMERNTMRGALAAIKLARAEKTAVSTTLYVLLGTPPSEIPAAFRAFESNARVVDTLRETLRHDAEQWGRYIGTLAGAAKAGQTIEKTWVSLMDGRERPSHNALHQTTIALSATWDDAGIPRLVPGGWNCRCRVEYSVVTPVQKYDPSQPRDADGKWSATGAGAMPDTIDVDGRPRPTRNSLGQPIADSEDALRRFHEWFGDSKITDDAGRPKVMYHGTSAEFESFNANPRGAFFASDPAGAAVFSKLRKGTPRIIEGYLAIRNPWTMVRYADTTPFSQQVDQTPAALAAKGYDGIDFGKGTVVAFRPAQIKATDNVGTFSPDDDRIAKADPLPPDPGATILSSTGMTTPTGDDMALSQQATEAIEKAFLDLEVQLAKAKRPAPAAVLEDDDDEDEDELEDAEDDDEFVEKYYNVRDNDGKFSSSGVRAFGKNNWANTTQVDRFANVMTSLQRKAIAERNKAKERKSQAGLENQVAARRHLQAARSYLSAAQHVRDAIQGKVKFNAYGFKQVMRLADDSRRRVPMAKAYSPSQPRDEDGRWATVGGSRGASAVAAGGSSASGGRNAPISRPALAPRKASSTATHRVVDYGPDLTAYDTPEIKRMRAEARALKQTADMPGREKLREQIERDVYGTGAERKDRVLHMIMGGPGTGKSTAIGDRLQKETGALLVDSDEVKKHPLLEPHFKGGKGAGVVHVESADINDKILERALLAGDNIVLPIVGKTRQGLDKKIDAAARLGYQVHLHYVHLPTEVAVKRVIKRMVRSNRFVDPDYVVNDVNGHPEQNFNYMRRDRRLASATGYDNNVEQGQPPRITYRRQRKTVQPRP